MKSWPKKKSACFHCVSPTRLSYLRDASKHFCCCPCRQGSPGDRVTSSFRSGSETDGSLPKSWTCSVWVFESKIDQQVNRFSDLMSLYKTHLQYQEIIIRIFNKSVIVEVPISTKRFFTHGSFRAQFPSFHFLAAPTLSRTTTMHLEPVLSRKSKVDATSPAPPAVGRWSMDTTYSWQRGPPCRRAAVRPCAAALKRGNCGTTVGQT